MVRFSIHYFRQDVKEVFEPMNVRTKKIVFSALFAALVCVATMIVKIPSGLNGYLNLGDCVVLAAGWLLSPLYGFVAAGLGSALADLLAGYLIYAPATFFIKGLMALGACLVLRSFSKKLGSLPSKVIGGLLAEAWMVLGYLLFESLLYGFVPSLVNVLGNAVQGAVGLVLGVLLVQVLERLLPDLN